MNARIWFCWNFCCALVFLFKFLNYVFSIIDKIIQTINLYQKIEHECENNTYQNNRMKFNKLTDQERKIIKEKGTEAPHSGEYDNFFQKGAFACRRCGALLYRSEDKFDAHCGWPSFDDEIFGAVKRSLDSDAERTEITCARCGAHLGHVFDGEKLTPKNTRHCVNSLSMKFVPEKELMKKQETAYFAGGCFWCLDAMFRALQGVIYVNSGYAGGTKENPTYEEASSGLTGHAETVEVVFNPLKISFEALLTVFFATHDPTTKDRQGDDVGSQYRSAIFHVNELQKELAENFVKNLEVENVFDGKIITEIVPLKKFYLAEEYHQNYYTKNSQAGYCQAVINPKLVNVRAEFGKWLKRKED
jgi:peptide methionine sulfoxide reductase msrA/msrB